MSELRYVRDTHQAKWRRQCDHCNRRHVCHAYRLTSADAVGATQWFCNGCAREDI